MTAKPAARTTSIAARLLGRETEVKRLDNWWRGSLRTLCVVGASGVGKTALVRHWSAGLTGALWCSIDEARSASELAERLAWSLGLPSGAGPTWPAVHAALQSRRAGQGNLLLVLDGFEGLVDAAPEVLERLETLDGLRIVTLSRYSPALKGAARMDLFGLSLGREGGAVEMFAAVAERFADPCAWTEREWAAATAIVALLDGVPLAIELEASRIELLSLAALRDRLGQPGADVGGQLRGAIEASCVRLSSSHRDALATLACLPGGFSTTLAEEVLAERGVEAPFEGLAALLRASLLRMDSAIPDRCCVYRSVRIHVGPAIGSAERQAIRNVLLRHVESLADAGFHGESLRALRLEVTNIEESIDSCAPQSPEQLDVALRLLRVLDGIRARGGRLERHAEMLRTWLGHAARRSSDRATLWLQLAFGRALRELGRPVASQCLERLVDNALLRGDIEIAARGVAQLALATAQSDPVRASQRCTTSLAVFEGSGDLQYLGFAHGFLGVSLRESGALEEAASHFAGAVATLVAARDERAQAIARGFGADVALERAYPEAETSNLRELQRAVDELRAMGELRYAATHGLLLAIGYATANELASARAAAQAAEQAARTAVDAPTRALAMLVEAAVAPDVAAHDAKVAQARDLALSSEGQRALCWVEAWSGQEELPGRGGAVGRRLGQLRRLRASRHARRLRVFADLSKMVLPDGTTIDLKRKPLVRRIVTALVGRHTRGARIGFDQLIADCWPGESFSDPSSARNRLHVALSALRKLGLGPLMERNSDGYRLVPTLIVEMVSASSEVERSRTKSN